MTNMGSNSVASFLTKLLRPDKKEKQKQPMDKKRRHSAPVPDWCEITEAEQHPANVQKLPDKQRKQHVKYASQQNLAGTKKQKQVKSKQANNKSKRQSAGFPSWFCVSGNTETLERTALPLTDNGSSNHGISNNQRLTANNVKLKNDVSGLNEGKKGKAKENRYAASPVEWTNKKTAKIEQTGLNGKVPKPVVKQVRRDLSPGVKYRTDGTLEKPYVFPAGLTFGPEGRKLQLRRTNHYETPGNQSRSNGKTVQVDVHRSSTEDIIMEYSYEEIHVDPGEFDVRKAFYLKYDSDFSEAKTQESAVNCDDNYRQRAFNYNNEHSYTRKGNTDKRQNNIDARKVQETLIDGRKKINHQYNDSRQERCRYSMPPQNDDLVYMGSFENVNLSDYVLNKKDTIKSGLNVGANIRRSGRDTTKSRRNRYSMPARNSELVYMGSFENVNQLLTGNANVASGFSLCSDANETGEISQYNDNERSKGSSAASVNQKEKRTAAVKEQEQYVLSGYKYHRRCDSIAGTSTLASSAVAGAMETTSLLKRNSMSSIDRPKNLSNASQNVETDARFTSGDEDSDVFDASSLSGDINDNNPFLTRRGRSSCMPGNSRLIAPPPAVTTSYSSSSSTDTHSARSSLFIPGSRRFSLPPPPNYTPPKEEMEFTHAHLKEMNCHKGSQTDLSIDLEHLTMEDRDASLEQEEVKTIYAGETFQISALLGGDPTDRGKLNRPVIQDRTQKDISVNMELYAHMSDVSDLSHCSDEVFQDANNSVSEDNKRTKTGRFTKFKSKVSSNLQQTELPITTSVSYSKELDQKSSITESKIKSRTTLSEVSCKSPSTASKTTHTSTPASSGRSQLQWSGDNNTSYRRDKPIPVPRKIYHTDSMNKDREQAAVGRHSPQAFIDSLVQPVPKQRRSLAYSRSISPSNNYEIMSSSLGSQDARRSNRQHLLRTQSCDQSSTLLRKQNNVRSEVSQDDFSQNIYVSINDDNVYEEIDPQLNTSDLNSTKYENIYDECENIDSEKQNKLEKNQVKHGFGKNGNNKFENSLSPLQTIALSVSPGQKRRNFTAQKETPTHSSATTQSQNKCGLTECLVQSDGVCVMTGQGNGGVIAMIDIDKKYQYDDSDDNSSIADDEMSLSNDEDMEAVAKRYSLRRCVSADNLLRSGSIIDRSMILAKRRRKRLREQRSKSQLQLTTDAKHNLDSTTFKVHYTKRKRTSKERLFKLKPSHTDSGHDSEIVSPCTSPDTRRHVDNMTSMNNNDGANDSDSWVPRQGTLPRKSWEIRLRNTQHLRKCRSRESLVTPSTRMYAASNSVFDTGY